MKRTNGKFWGKLMAIAALFCLAAMFASCDNAADSGKSLSADEQKIVGKWLDTLGANTGYEFKSDKTASVITGGMTVSSYTWSTTSTQVTIKPNGSTTVSLVYPYTISGNTLTLTISNTPVNYTKQ